MSESKKWYKNIFEKLYDKYQQLDTEVGSEVIFKEVKGKKTKEFVGIIFRELGNLLDEQVYEKKNGEIICPPKIIVFLSSKNDKEWRGAKREALKEDLENICFEKVKEIADSSVPITDYIEIELRLDGSLKEGTIRAEHRWEENETGEETTKLIIFREEDEDSEKTIHSNQISNQIFYIEVWHKGEKQTEQKFLNNSIIIGRNSDRKGKVELHVADDPRIARHHAVLEIDKEGTFWLTSKGDNETRVDNDVIPPNKTIKVNENQKIQIFDFTLRVKR